MPPMAVLAAWSAARGRPASTAERNGQKAWASKLSEEGVTRADLEDALAGMDEVMGDKPWDLRDLRFNLAKAKPLGRGRRAKRKRREEEGKAREAERIADMNRPLMSPSAMRGALREHAPEIADRLSS